MKMHPKDAAKILGISGDITPEIVKRAYKVACSKYHPDRNPGGLEMMKAVNIAYEVLKDTTETIELNEGAINYGEELNAAIGAIIDLPGLVIELCGSWLWVSGDTKPHKDAIKAAGFKWAPKKKMWSFHPADSRTSSRGRTDMDKIRDKYGSNQVRGFGRARLAS